MPDSRQLLRITCGATVNPHKYKLVHWRDGFKYLGVIIRGDKAYPSGRVVGHAFDVVRCYNKVKNKGAAAQRFVQRLNSYLGLMKHYDCEEAREKLLAGISLEWSEYVAVAESREKLINLKPVRPILREKLRRGRRKFNQIKYSIKCELSEHASLQPTM